MASVSSNSNNCRTPREHIEELRRKWFSIGAGETSPLAPMLDRAVKYLSAELYTKDVHFLMELIQNAEDNEYLEGADPSLEFVITSQDITCSGAPATLLVFNNERGFSARNIESICNVGDSTKKGNRKRGYIGEKGIGFKSVFLITGQPYIFSNGYQICFNEKPCPDCKLGYIVPAWVEENPSLSDIRGIYGSDSGLPATTLVLPLKPDKVNAVKQQLSSIHPEVLLFLSKIKCLSVREVNEDPRLNTVTQIAITKETNFVTRKNIDAESYTLYLTAEEGDNSSEKECSYYIWKQKFPVKPENKVERRMEVEEWVVTLAFPNGDRLSRGMKSPGVYAFLPTEMITNFPFIIQADFILASSRETILLDDVWNQGILDCVPSAFVNALVSLVTTTADAPISSLPRMFEFLPVNSSAIHKLNGVRDSIRAKLAEENIIPSESYVKQKFFHKPHEVGRLNPAFWNILEKAGRQGVNLQNLSSHGCSILASSFDKPQYDNILNFLGVSMVSDEWYAKCIRGSNLVMGVDEGTYLELLLLIAENWQSMFRGTNMGDIPLIKYVDVGGNVCLFSINESAIKNGGRSLAVSREPQSISWLIIWNEEFGCVADVFFLPKRMQTAFVLFSRKETVLRWLANVVKVASFSVYDYACVLRQYLTTNRRLTLVYSHFLYHSWAKKHVSPTEVGSLCNQMLLVDNYSNVITKWNGVIIPSTGSKWSQLVVSNPWRREGYVELGEEYINPATLAGQETGRNQIVEFLKNHLSASDIPQIAAPNAEISTFYTSLTKENVFLLLNWIRNLMHSSRLPEKFLSCIKKGSWLNVTVNGAPCYRPPSLSFLLDASTGNSWGNLLQNGSILVDIPLVNQSFYGHRIKEYKVELKACGVMFEYGEACEFIGKRLMSLAASSSLTRSNALSILAFIRFLRKNYLPPEKFINSIKEEKWLRTSCSMCSPVCSVLYNQEWAVARQIANVQFIDQDYYGDEILSFESELKLLGVAVEFNQKYQLVVDNLKSPSDLSFLRSEALILALDCMRFSTTSSKVVSSLRNTRCLKTNAGYKNPGACFLFDPDWGSIMKVFSCFPLVESSYYGPNIVCYRKELQQLGVIIDFEDAMKAFVPIFRQQASSRSITTENVFAFLESYRKLRKTSLKFPSDLKSCIQETKWLRTRLADYRAPNECILFGSEWESIRRITCLPFIDDGDRCYGKGIYEYEKELKTLGVAVELQAGVNFIVNGLHFPVDPSDIGPDSVLSLLNCIRILTKEKGQSLPDVFKKNISREWLKTRAGYRSPSNCCLFNPKWKHVKETDGPFIDEQFYGPKVKTYCEELQAIGVAVDVQKVCPLLADHLTSLSEFAAIVRTQNFLREFGWIPSTDAKKMIWIPNGSNNGKWVNSEQCVIHDKDGLFGFRLNVLDKHYQPDLLGFFSTALDVKSKPSLDNYLSLWKDWESAGRQLTRIECGAFWRGILGHCISKTAQATLAAHLAMLPALSGSGEFMLIDKCDVFIADDLFLKDLFAPHPLFVWLPEGNSPFLPRTKLLNVYRQIGVRTISEAVEKQELSLSCSELKQVNPSQFYIGKVLVELILGFLAVPAIEMEPKMRHEAVKCLLNNTLLETNDPITVEYSLKLSSDEVINKRMTRMIRWDKESSKLFVQNLENSNSSAYVKKNLIEHATHFSEVIATGVLWDKEDHIGQLSELIKSAFLLDFDEPAVCFLMKSKNLQIFSEDEEFLSRTFTF